MPWFWLLPACATLAAVVLCAVMLRRLGDEARALRLSLSQWNRLAVAIGDLEHTGLEAERDLRRLTARRRPSPSSDAVAPGHDAR